MHAMASTFVASHCSTFLYSATPAAMSFSASWIRASPNSMDVSPGNCVCPARYTRIALEGWSSRMYTFASCSVASIVGMSAIELLNCFSASRNKPSW